jgi:hypothetical protein
MFFDRAEGPAVSAIYAADNDYHMGNPRENVVKNKTSDEQHDNRSIARQEMRKSVD